MSTPEDVFRQLSDGIGSGDWSGLHRLYAEEASVEIPFTRPRAVHLHGREQVREHFARFGGQISFTPKNIRIHRTGDPEVIVAEFDYETGGEPLANIQVLRVRDGLIVESRDYHNHAAIAEMMS